MNIVSIYIYIIHLCNCCCCYIVKITIEIDNDNLITFTIPYNYHYTFGNLGKDLSAIIGNGKSSSNSSNVYFISILDYDSTNNSNNNNVIIPSMKVVPLLIANPNKYNKLKIYQHNNGGTKIFKPQYNSNNNNNTNSFQYQIDSTSSNVVFPKKDYSLYYKEKLYGGDNNTSTNNNKLNPSSSSHQLKENHSNKDIISSSNALYSYHQVPPTTKEQPLLTDYHSSSYTRKTELQPIQNDFTSSTSKHALYSYEKPPIQINHSELDEYYKKGYGKYSTSNAIDHSNNSNSNNNNNNDILKNIDSSNSAGNIKIVSSTSNTNKDNYKKFSSEKRSYRPYSTTNIPMSNTSTNINVQQPQKEQSAINRRRNEQNPLINSDLYMRLSKQQNIKTSKTEDNEITEQQLLPLTQQNKYQFTNTSSYTPGITTMNNFDMKTNINTTRNTYSTNILQEPFDMNMKKGYTGYKSTLRENPANVSKQQQQQNIHSHSHLQQYNNTGEEDYF